MRSGARDFRTGFLGRFGELRDGRSLLPGFVDAHTHFVSGGLQLGQGSTIDGLNPEGWISRERISLDEALAAYTVGGARAGPPLGACTGVLRSGAYADLVVLSRDIFDVPGSGIADLRVDRTVVEGAPCTS